jgi:hypothetical protein
LWLAAGAGCVSALGDGGAGLIGFDFDAALGAAPMLETVIVCSRAQPHWMLIVKQRCHNYGYQIVNELDCSALGLLG